MIDLLNDSSSDEEKHAISHLAACSSSGVNPANMTTVSNMTMVTVHSAMEVFPLLQRAARKRYVCTMGMGEI